MDRFPIIFFCWMLGPGVSCQVAKYSHLKNKAENDPLLLFFFTANLESVDPSVCSFERVTVTTFCRSFSKGELWPHVGVIRISNTTWDVGFVETCHAELKLPLLLIKSPRLWIEVFYGKWMVVDPRWRSIFHRAFSKCLQSMKEIRSFTKKEWGQNGTVWVYMMCSFFS